MMKYPTGNKLLLLLFLFLRLMLVTGQERKPVPAYTGHLNDFAGLLKEEEKAQLESQLMAYEDSTSTQIAVVIEQNLNGRDVYQRAMDFARGWEVGQKEKRNGVVMYFAVDDRLIAIATADKTQGALGDGETGSIIRNVIRPEFKKGNYYLGISNGITAIGEALEGEFSPDKHQKKKSRSAFIYIIIVIFIVLYLLSKFGGGRNGGYSRGGGYFLPGGGWGGFGGGGGFNGGGATGSW
jgi:uncharacterized protein